MSTISATEASRNFSSLLDRVAAGERVELTRGGVAIARVVPGTPRTLDPDRFRALIEAAPRPDDAWVAEARELRRSVEPAEDPWRS